MNELRQLAERWRKEAAEVTGGSVTDVAIRALAVKYPDELTAILDRMDAQTNERIEFDNVVELAEHMGMPQEHVDRLRVETEKALCGNCHLPREECHCTAPKFDTECVWIESDDGLWYGPCGVEWEFIYDGPKENHMNYCPRCGKKLVPQAALNNTDSP